MLLNKLRDFKRKVVVSFILLIIVNNIDYSKIFVTEEQCKAYMQNPWSSHLCTYTAAWTALQYLCHDFQKQTADEIFAKDLSLL